MAGMDSIIPPVAQRPVFVDSTAVDISSGSDQSAASVSVRRRHGESSSLPPDRSAQLASDSGELFVIGGVAWACQTVSCGDAKWRMMIADDGRVAFFSVDAVRSVGGNELRTNSADSRQMIRKLLPPDDGYTFFVCC